MNRLVIGNDHRGFKIKNFLLQQRMIGDHVIQWHDVGTDQSERADYPQYAFKAIKKVLAQESSGAILLCGTGVGMSIAANRFKRIYGALVWNADIAKRAKEEDNANVLILPADYLQNQEIINIIDAWLSANFLGEQYQSRLRELDMF